MCTSVANDASQLLPNFHLNEIVISTFLLTSHSSEILLDRAQILYAFGNAIPIDFPALVFRLVSISERSPVRIVGLPFGTLISLFLEAWVFPLLHLRLISMLRSPLSSATT
ncbi:hypothetical protein L1049_021737 [Liquidambar formosana]|uniref:Uncharacterized protein n=1 Tax=Liquidambar formosana TaxID=63359 RepID=A0AAP0RBC1_LIQFO